MIEYLKQEIEGAMQDPAVIAFALLYKAFKPTVLKQLGLGDAQQQQALPHHHQQPHEQYQHQMPQQHQPQAPHTIQIPQMPPDKK